MQGPDEAFLVLSIEFLTREKDESRVSLLRIVFSLAFDLGALKGVPECSNGCGWCVCNGPIFQLPTWRDTIRGKCVAALGRVWVVLGSLLATVPASDRLEAP